jgi:hypothetical protein
MAHRLLPPLGLTLWLLPGCGSSEDATQAAKEASDKAIAASKDKAAELAEDAQALGNEAALASKKAATEAVDASAELMGEALDASKKAATEAVDATKAQMGALFDDLRNDGELSQTAKAWLSEQADKAAETDIEAVVDTGVQLAPVALEASKVLIDAVDADTAIEPIFQKVGDDPAKVDAAIGDMPRVEAIDGLTVGFKLMDRLESGTAIKQRGYLVMWRSEEYLVGFVYRTMRALDLETLVAETPRLVKLTQQALAD